MSVMAASMREQYARAWEMLRGLVDGLGDDAWTAETPNAPAPVRYAVHAVESTDFYLRTELEGYRFATLFGADWEGPLEGLPDRAAATAVIEATARRTDAWLAGLSDDDLLGSNPFHWTGATVLSRLAYNLRHMLYHMGEMSAAMRAQGATETPWA
jgi:uncharacterized damage-inducible protein DinB